MTRLTEFLGIERELARANHVKFARYYDQPFETLSNDQVAITGIDGWQYISNGNNAWEQQYLGQVILDEPTLQAWQQTFARRQSHSAAIGARFAHLVIPEKQAILPYARWPECRQINTQRPVLQLRQRIESGLVYPIERLQAESWRAELSFRGNSHWCVSGAWFGFCELMQVLCPELKFDFEYVPLVRTWWRHDLLLKYTNELCFESVIAIERRSHLIYDNRLLATSGAHVGNHYILQNEQAPYQCVVVIFGDSYSFDIGFSDLLSAFFGQVHFIWNTMIDFKYCKHVNAQLILMQSAERYLIRPHLQDRPAG